MKPSPSHQREGTQNSARWSFLAAICLVAIAVCFVVVWLSPKPRQQETSAAPDAQDQPGDRASQREAAATSRDSRTRSRIENSVTRTASGQTAAMAALASSLGITEEVERAIHNVVSLGESVVPDLELLVAPSQNANVRAAAARALAEIGTSKSIAVLLQAISVEQNDDQRRALVSALHALSSPAAAHELATALVNSKDQIVFPTIRDTLARLADDATTRLIATTFHEEANEGWQQSNLMGALARVRSPEAVPALREIMFTDSNSSFRSEATVALAFIGTQDAIQSLLDAVEQSRSVALTTLLVESLSMVSNKDSLSNLVGLLNQSPNENVRYAAASALGNISSTTSVSALESALQTETSATVNQTIQASLYKLSQAARSIQN